MYPYLPFKYYRPDRLEADFCMNICATYSNKNTIFTIATIAYRSIPNRPLKVNLRTQVRGTITVSSGVYGTVSETVAVAEVLSQRHSVIVVTKG